MICMPKDKLDLQDSSSAGTLDQMLLFVSHHIYQDHLHLKAYYWLYKKHYPLQSSLTISTLCCLYI